MEDEVSRSTIRSDKIKERKRIGERIVRVRRDSLVELVELVELWDGEEGEEGEEEALVDML